MSSKTGIQLWPRRLLREGPRVSSPTGDEPSEGSSAPWVGAAAEINAPVLVSVAAAPRRSPVRAAIATMRPRQWIKNGLVVMAPMAAGGLGSDHVPVHVGLAAIAFCLLASGIYPINDVRDAEEDRLHPRKRFRPVPAGELTPAQAIALGLTLMLSGMVVCWLVRPLLAVVGAGYLALTLSYTLIWRHVQVLDVGAVAGGFVLRAVAGGVAAPVALSRWFLLVVSASAVFVAAAKRHAELRRSSGEGDPRRRVLESYSVPLLGLILGASATIALLAYCGWASKVPTAHGIPWRPLTALPFALGLVRYGAIVRAGGGEAPEEVVLKDRLLQLAGIAWLVLFALGVNAVG